MPRVIRSSQADADIYEIARYIAEDNPTAAYRWIDRIDERADLLAEMPGMGRVRDDLMISLRSYRVGNYLIFYRRIAEGIELVRVVHGSRDLHRVFRAK